MSKKIYIVLAVVLLTRVGVTLPAEEAPITFEASYGASIVELEISKIIYNFQIPWVTENSQSYKNGILIEGNQILTTADGLAGQLLIRVRKEGKQQQYLATPLWIDYYSNLALLKVTDPAFWEETHVINLAEKISTANDLQIIRWRNGRFENRSAEIERFSVDQSRFSYIEHLQLIISSEMNAAGWAEAIIQDQKIIGLTTSMQGDNRLTVLPSPLIASFLRKREKNENTHLGHFDFLWMSGKNPSLLASKGLKDTNQGVVITEVGGWRIAPNVLKEGDIIIEIDQFPISLDGKYIDPDYGRLRLNALATRNHFAGDSIPIKIWRDGNYLTVDYTLPKADFEKDLVPDARYDQAPEYLIAGGLIFQPLTGSYLKTFGKKKPILLEYWDKYGKDPDRSGLIILSSVLPDPYNHGYENIRYVIVDQINGKKINTLLEVVEAFNTAKTETHLIQFMHDQFVQYITLDTQEMAAATARIIKHYNIPKNRHIEAFKELKPPNLYTTRLND